LPGRDRPSARAPEKAKFKDLERKSRTQLVNLAGFWIGRDETVMGTGVNAERQVVLSARDEGRWGNAILFFPFFLEP